MRIGSQSPMIYLKNHIMPVFVTQSYVTSKNLVQGDINFNQIMVLQSKLLKLKWPLHYGVNHTHYSNNAWLSSNLPLQANDHLSKGGVLVIYSNKYDHLNPIYTVLNHGVTTDPKTTPKKWYCTFSVSNLAVRFERSIGLKINWLD